MRKGGFEPPQPSGHRILNPARLPVPPLSRYIYFEQGSDPTHLRLSYRAVALGVFWVKQGPSVSERPCISGCLGRGLE